VYAVWTVFENVQDVTENITDDFDKEFGELNVLTDHFNDKGDTLENRMVGSL
jgi:hypothetical protein